MKFNGFILTALFVSLIFTVLPLPDGSVFSIDILVLLLISFSYHFYKHPPGLWLAWLLGLLQDVFLGALLGEHALALTVTHFMILKLIRRLRFFALWQQVLCVGGLTMINQLLVALIESFHGHFASIFILIAPAVMSMVCWLIISIMFLYYKDTGRLL